MKTLSYSFSLFYNHCRIQAFLKVCNTWGVMDLIL